MAERGVTRYGPADREERKVVARTNIPAPSQNATSASMAGMVPTTSSSSGWDYSQNPLEVAREFVKSLNLTPTPSYASLGSRPDASDVLARRKYEDELAKEKRQIEAYQQMLSGGGYRTGADRMLGLINAQGDTSKGAIEKSYKDALANILGGFTTADDLTGKGYSALENYLTQNPNNPYAGVQVSAGQAPDAMEQILSAYGVSADPVRAQVAAEQAAAEQGAAGFQNLLNTLGASAQQSDASRLAEMMMAQNLAKTTLGQQRFGYESQAAQAQAQALAELQNRLAEARLEQESNAESRRQRIEDEIADAGGDIPKGSGDDDEQGDDKQGDDKQDGAQATPQKPVDALKARAATANPDLKKKIKQFVKANPNAGIKKIEKAFPKIAAKIK
jgi:hypothetical protein